MTDKPLLGRHDAVPRRRWRWLLPTVVALAALALAGSLIARAVGDDDTDAPKAALDAYLEAVETGATTRAYGMLCADKAKPSRQDFAAAVARDRKDSGGVVRHRIGEVERKSSKLAVATYTVQFERTYKWLAAALVREGDVWKLCGFQTIPRPELRLPADEIPVPPGFTDTGTTTTTR